MCINHYFKLHKKKTAEEENIEEDLEKTKKTQEISILITPPNISPEKPSPEQQEGSPENPQIHELIFQLETQKYEIEDLKSTIQKLQNENQFVL